MIWFKNYTLEELNIKAKENNILKNMGLSFIELGKDYIKATLPVDHRTKQPYGILHGGASCVLAETLGSFASLLVIDLDKEFAVGSVITANHLRPAKEGVVTGTCRPVHVGRSKHVWEIIIENEAGKLIAKCELTCAVTGKLAS